MIRFIFKILCFIPVFLNAQVVIEKAEYMPRFSECADAQYPECTLPKLSNFIITNLKYPSEARDKEVQGTVIIKFVVQKDGSITDMKIVQDLGEGCGNEALRVMRLMGDTEAWIPGKENGKEVAVQMTIPIQFKL